MSNTTKSPIKFAVIQSGYCVFGAGHTAEEAIAEAAQWMEGDLAPAEVEAQLVRRPNDGDLTLINSDNPEFGSYLRNQGGFTETNGEWFAD